MKRVSLIIPTLLSFLFLLGTTNIYAQQENSKDEKKKIVIVKKHVDEDGTVTVEKIVKEGAEADELIYEINTGDDAENTEIDVEIINDGDAKEIKVFKIKGTDNMEGGDLNIEFTDEDGNKVIKMRRAGEGGDPEVLEWKGQGEIPAEIQKKLDEMGVDFNRHHGNNHFKHRIRSHKSNKAFLGVMLKESIVSEDGEESIEGVTENGVIVDDVIGGSAAEEAGLQKGDVITAINGQSTKTLSELTGILGKQSPGDKVDIQYLRNDQPGKTQATLKANTNNAQGFKWDHNYDFDFDFDNDFDFEFDGDRPCVFIGVYVNNTDISSSKGGAKVTGIIDNTPAAEAQILRGDIITAINNNPVSNYNELLTERNKYNPGDQVTMSILRSGESQNIDITFRECDQSANKKQERIIIINKSKEEADEGTDNNEIPTTPEPNSVQPLELENFRAFPNPTAGQVTVRFSGEAVPTSLRIVDLSGREIFSETLNNFDGNYNNRIDLSQAPTGTLLLSIQQDDKVFTQTLVRSEGAGL